LGFLIAKTMKVGDARRQRNRAMRSIKLIAGGLGRSIANSARAWGNMATLVGGLTERMSLG
jgi:hypothetical protein